MLKLENISLHYGELNLFNQMNLQIDQPGLYCITGKSGCGKTTLLNIIAGYEKNYTGDVEISHDLKKGFIFQTFELIPELDVKENLALSGLANPISDDDILQMAKKLQIDSILDHEADEISYGQKQRVAIARALACNPRILLCDEATSALDPQTTSSILDLLKDINKRFGITIVIITHQMSVVREICTNVAIMSSGKVIETGSVADVFAHPKEQITKELLKGDTGNEKFQEKDLTEVIDKGERIRITFSENSAFEPVIANLILAFSEPVNILYASTKNVGGVAKGEMILEFKPGCTKVADMKKYISERGIEIEEVINNVDA